MVNTSLSAMHCENEYITVHGGGYWIEHDQIKIRRARHGALHNISYYITNDMTQYAYDNSPMEFDEYTMIATSLSSLTVENDAYCPFFEKNMTYNNYKDWRDIR